jgi:hypothetical protein
MPIPPPVTALDRFLIITPNADEVGVEAALSISITSPLYTAADPAPRTQTHAYTAFKATEAKRVEINAVESGFPSSVFEKYDSKNQKTYVADRLLGLGLTVDPGVI